MIFRNENNHIQCSSSCTINTGTKINVKINNKIMFLIKLISVITTLLKLQQSLFQIVAKRIHSDVNSSHIFFEDFAKILLYFLQCQC